MLTQFIFITLALLYHGRCHKMESFVVHGEEANISEFPYSVYLNIKCVYEDKKKESFMCGGSILTQHLVLTAAHCTDSCSENTDIVIYVGSVEKKLGAVSSAHSFVNNREYNLRKNSHDIALVRTKTPFEYSVNVSRVAIMPNPPYDEEATVAGWGVMDESIDKFPDRIRFTKQHVLSKVACSQRLNSKMLGLGTFCAFDSKGHAAKGDSGSALVVRGYIQIGLVSYKMLKVTEQNRNLVVYTDVGYFYDWIQTNARSIMCNV